MSRFKQASDQWNREVEEIAAEMVEAGTEPGTALVQANVIVGQRRRAKIEGDARKLLESIGKGSSLT